MTRLWPGPSLPCSFAPQWRRTKPPIHGRKDNDTTAESFGEPQTPAELP